MMDLHKKSLLPKGQIPGETDVFCLQKDRMKCFLDLCSDGLLATI